MEQLLLFCCRACLKGEGDNREYYDLLGIDNPSGANTESIKRAYKIRSLQMHPDKLAQKGVEITSDHSLQFQKMKEAYDVLSDPRKRRLYDELGASGLKLIESPSEVNPAELIRNFQKNRADRAKIAVVIALVFCIILLEPVLFCLKCDGTINSPWLAIWAPIWGLDFIFLSSAVLFLLDRQQHPSEEGEEPKEQVPLHTKLLFGLQTLFFVLAQIFILMRLDAEIRWNMFAVFAPWFAWEFVSNVEGLPSAFATINKPDADSLRPGSNGVDEEETMHVAMLEAEYFEKVLVQVMRRKQMIVSCIRCWQAVFLALKTGGSVDWNWGLTFLPVWSYLLFQVYSSILMHRWGSRIMEGIDVAAVSQAATTGEADPMDMMKLQHGGELKAGAVAGVILQLPVTFMAILLVVRLEQAAIFSTFIIILPVFIAIGCCICGVGCGLCCLSNMSTEEAQDVEQKQGSEASRRAASSNGLDGGSAVYGTFTAPPAADEARPVVVVPVPPPHATVLPPVVSDATPPPPPPPRLLEQTSIDIDID